jgi:hypothetical protein
MIPPSRYDYVVPIPFTLRVKEFWAKVWEYVWPVLLFLLSPFLWFARLFLSVYIRIYIRFFAIRKVSNKAMCPACGCRKKHEVVYDAIFERLLHTCARCHANWPEAPVVSTDKWKVFHEPMAVQRPEVPDVPWATSSPEQVSLTTVNGTKPVPKVEIKVN